MAWTLDGLACAQSALLWKLEKESNSIFFFTSNISPSTINLGHVVRRALSKRRRLLYHIFRWATNDRRVVPSRSRNINTTGRAWSPRLWLARLRPRVPCRASKTLLIGGDHPWGPTSDRRAHIQVYSFGRGFFFFWLILMTKHLKSLHRSRSSTWQW